MSVEQAQRLAGTPCCWCRRPIYRLPSDEDARYVTLRRFAQPVAPVQPLEFGDEMQVRRRTVVQAHPHDYRPKGEAKT